MEFFIQLQKADAARREVWGIAALEQPDSAGEIMDYERSKPHFEAWSAAMHKASGGKSLGNIRESHTVKAIGKVISLVFDDVKKAVNICGKIFDSEAWAKVEAGVLTGFSIGGAYGGPPWDDPLHKGLRRYVAIPNEISLVDKPAMPGAVFQMLKADGAIETVLLKGDPMQDKLTQLLAAIAESGDEKMKALAAEIEAEFKTEEATEGEAEAGEQSSQVEKSAPEGGEEAPDEAEKQPESVTPDAVKAIVVDILKQLGIVKDDGAGQAAKADAAGALQKANALAKSVDALQAGQKQLTSDVAQLAVALDALEKRGAGIGPVLRDLGAVSPAAQADMQKAGVLRELLKASTDPQTIQALQAEITRLEIKAAQTK